MINIKRVYADPEEEDGYRILIDRLWPRGMSKAKAKLNLWMKEIAPTEELRQWFNHEPEKWAEFQRRYKKELATKPEMLERIKETEEEKGTVTLVYSAKDEEHNNAVVLKAVLESQNAIADQ